MLPLIFAEKDKEYIIKRIKTRDKNRCKLIENGFHEGKKIFLVGENRNSYVVKIDDMKYILDFRLANKIVVEKV